MKKALSLILVIVLALGMSTTAFAALDFEKNPAIATTTGTANATEAGFLSLQTDATAFVGSIEPGLIFEENIPTDAFHPNSDAVGTIGTDGYLRTQIGSKITVRTKIARGSSVIDEVKLTYLTIAGATTASEKTAHLYVSIVNPFKNNSLEGMDFDFTVYPVVAGGAWTDYGVQFEGTLTNTDTEVYADTDLVDLFDGQIANVMEYNRKLEYNLGEGVSVWGKGIKNAKYWGVANTEPTEAQDEVMSKYDIDQIYNISHIGLASISDYVKLNDADPAAYVYNKDMKYLGRGKDELDFSEAYYLASAMLDIEEEEEEEEEPEDEELTDDPVAPPDLGGEGYPTNVNDNPGTGK